MKTAEVKTSSTARNHVQAKRQPFFSKEGQDSFFSKTNNTTTSFFSPSIIQPKLTIGQPNDKYEIEADAMADKVVQRLSDSSNQNASTDITSPSIQRKCSSCEEEEKLQKKEDDFAHNGVDLQRKPIFESNAEQPNADIQSKPLTIPVLQAKCSSCEQEEKLQKKEEEELSENEPTLQRKATDLPSENSQDLESRLSSSKGGGSSLSPDTQSTMSSAFGTDFSNVRVHTGSEAVQMSQNIGAQAFTHGSDIYFNKGKYDANSTSGKHLLAHELTHTVQQNSNMLNKQEIAIPNSDTIPTNQESTQLNDEYEEVVIPEGEEIEDTPCPDLIPEYPTEPNVGRVRNEDENLYEKILNSGGDYIDQWALLRYLFPNPVDLWNNLPLQMKVLVIDRVISGYISNINSTNYLSGNYQFIETIVKQGYIAFALRLRSLAPQLKVSVFEKAITLMVNPNFYLGVLKGLVVGFFIDGLVGIVQMVIDLICLIPKIKNFFQAIGRFLGLIPAEMQALLQSISGLENEVQEVVKNAGKEFNEIINDPSRMEGILSTLASESTRISGKIGETVADFYVRMYEVPAFHLGEIIGRIIGQLLFEIITVAFTFGGGIAITAIKGIFRLAGKLLKKIGQFIFTLIRVLKTVFRHAIRIISGVLRFLTSGFRRVAGKLRLVLGNLGDIFTIFNRVCRIGSIRCLRRRFQRLVALRGVTIRGFRNAGEVMERIGNLRNRLARLGLTDVRIGIRGSSITDVSHSRGTGFRWLQGSGLNPSDVDIFITSPHLERRVRFLHGPGNPFPGGRISRQNFGNLMPDIADELEKFSAQTVGQLGRDSSVILLEQALVDVLPVGSNIIF